MSIQPVAQQTTVPVQTQQAKTEQTTAEAPTAQAATAAKAQTDSVALSKQAMQLSNSPGYSAGEEATESPAAKAAEKNKGQR